MKIEEIQKALAKKATKFTAGGFRPTNQVNESWIGRVSLFEDHEEIPIDKDGEPMMPLAQLYLPNLPFVPSDLAGIQLLTVFVSSGLPNHSDEMGETWLIREYTDTGNLINKDLICPNSFIKAFPLKAQYFENDYPIWDGGGVPYEIENEILKLESDGTIDCYYDIIEHCYEHKIGGYPSFCQSGIDFGDYNFIFQISSDPKINLNVVDNGSLMFSRNPNNTKWFLYYDFY